LYWYRAVGFKKADKITKESRERGQDIGAMFEAVLKDEKPKAETIAAYPKHFERFNEWKGKIKKIHGIETHLINNVDMYHGSPDLVADFGNGIEMVDYKVKERAFDYKILMNEAAYCEAWRRQYGDEIKIIRLVNFHPATGKIHEDVLDYNHKWLQDFFVCQRMWEVNKTAQAYWQKYCKSKLEG
jgi:hypothetical protein